MAQEIGRFRDASLRMIENTLRDKGEEVMAVDEALKKEGDLEALRQLTLAHAPTYPETIREIKGLETLMKEADKEFGRAIDILKAFGLSQLSETELEKVKGENQKTEVDLGEVVAALEPRATEATEAYRKKAIADLRNQTKIEAGNMVRNGASLEAINNFFDATKNEEERIKISPIDTPLEALGILADLRSLMNEHGLEATINLGEGNLEEEQVGLREYVEHGPQEAVLMMLDWNPEVGFVYTSGKPIMQRLLNKENLSADEIKSASSYLNQSRIDYLQRFVKVSGKNMKELIRARNKLVKERRLRYKEDAEKAWKKVDRAVMRYFGDLTLDEIQRDVFTRFRSRTTPEGFTDLVEMIANSGRELTADEFSLLRQRIISGLTFSKHYRFGGSRLQVTKEGKEAILLLLL